MMRSAHVFGVVFLVIAPPRALAQEEAVVPCDLHEVAEVEAANPHWIRTRELPVLALTLPENRTYKAEFFVRFGPLDYSWSVQDLRAVDELLEIQVEPPQDAYLHDLARDYVTDLSVVVTAYDDSGRSRFTVRAPPAFLGWPDGREASVRFFDQQSLASEAPAGVLSSSLRESLAMVTDLTRVQRVMPPLFFSEPPPADDLQLSAREGE